MAAANRGKCCKSVRLYELLEYPLLGGVLSHIGLASALSVRCLSVQNMPVLVRGPGSPEPQQGALLAPACFAVLWKYMLLCPLCQLHCSTGRSVEGPEGQPVDPQTPGPGPWPKAGRL